MAFDYASIRADNKRRYGTDIGRIGPMLLANRYADRTHFIYELLQNAEDALARRNQWAGQRAVRFALTEDELRVHHYGDPFDETDVRGICGIGEGTKDLTAVGRFGIGFKSVYAFTKRPEIHSGDHDFAVENYVWPTAVPPATRDPDETVIVLPLRDDTAAQEISRGLELLGPRTLLFLRKIEEISWSVEGGRSGLYVRMKPATLGEHVRKISLVSRKAGRVDTEEMWLVFSHPAHSEGTMVGHVEIAFSLQNGQVGTQTIQRVGSSPLVVFFPTVLPTHLGFLVQGPYRTTPSRDNVPPADPWNQHLVKKTAILSIDALCWLRDHGMLDAAALRCLPLDPDKFGDEAMFSGVFKAIREALLSQPLLPRSDDGHVPATQAKLARTRELRDLFEPKQLSALFGQDSEIAWLSGEITQDRMPEVRRYLIQDLDVAELTPRTILAQLERTFLEAQSDDWIRELYEFLNDQPALLRWSRLEEVPLVRLENGTHIAFRGTGLPHAFLPGSANTGFSMVRPTVCDSPEAREFLESLGLTEPDPIDDVTLNVLPKYSGGDIDIVPSEYDRDIERILRAFTTDSQRQRKKLIAALREAAFVKALDAGDGSESLSRPGNVYLATDSLKELFKGIKDVLLVDEGCACLRGENARALLEACGTVRYLRPIRDTSLSREERAQLRKKRGHPETSGRNDRVADRTLKGLDELLAVLPRIGSDQRRAKARLLWKELAHLEERRGKNLFKGEYTWTHYGSYEADFPAAFVRRLNSTAWVPDHEAELQKPESILFETLGWEPDSFLLSQIHFKPPTIDQLAREAGLDPGILDLLRKLGVRSESELRARLGIQEDTEVQENSESAGDETTPPEGDSPTQRGARGSREPGEKGATGTGGKVGNGGVGPGVPFGTSARRTGSAGTAGGKTAGRTSPFISYVGVHPDDQDPDPDGLSRTARMELEENAIQFILDREPTLRRTPVNNPGYDLFEAGAGGEPVRWIEVKAMTGSLEDRSVGLSRTQFEFATEYEDAYWLYVVEHAGESGHARLVRIQDPAGKARTFTFDRGWLHVALVDSTPID